MASTRSDHAVDIIDIHLPALRADGDEGAPSDYMRSQIVAGLTKSAGSKSLPTMLLYDTRGLRIYDKLTMDATEYYPFAAEENILKNHADSIVHVMHAAQGAVAGQKEEVVVELGAG